MDVHSKLKEIEATCNEYGFMELTVMPYGYGIKVRKMIDGWKDYDRCTEGSQEVIRAEIKGFEPILEHWIEYENEPMIAVRMTEGPNTGKVMEYHKSTAELFIEEGMAVNA